MRPSPRFWSAPRAIRASLSLSLALVAACGSNPAATNPGAGAANLPPQQNPGVASPSTSPGADQGPKRDLKGVVRDALSGEALDRATIFIEGIGLEGNSTPIPATPTPEGEASGMPSEAPSDGGFPPAPTGGDGAGAGGEGSFQVAQFLPPGASPSPLPSGASPSPLASGASPLPGTGLSPDPLASGAQVASGTASMPPLATTSPAAGTTPAAGSPGASPTASAAPGSPNPRATPYPATAIKPDSRGRFDLKGVPEGAYAVTVIAPGYQALTFQGNLPEELEISLRPLEPAADRVHTLQGVVRTADGRPAPEVEVELAARVGRYAGFHAQSDEAGGFKALAVPPGAYALAAFTTNPEGEVDAFSLLKEVPVAYGAERRTMSPSLSLRAVTATKLFAGSLEGILTEAEEKALVAAKKPVVGVRPVNVRAFISVADGEIPIASVPVGRDAYFRLRLPALPEGAAYHLVAAGQDEQGAMVFAHEHDLAEANPKLALTLPKPPGAFSVTERSRGPAFAWEAGGAEVGAYRVALESVGAEGDTLWEGWTSGTSVRLPNLQAFNLLKEGVSYRVTLTAIKTAGRDRVPLLAVATAPWASSSSTKAITFEVPRVRAGAPSPSAGGPRPLVMPSSLRSPAGAAQLPPSARPSARLPASPSARPSGAAGARPGTGGSPRPSPSPSTRYKPVTDL